MEKEIIKLVDTILNLIDLIGSPLNSMQDYDVILKNSYKQIDDNCLRKLRIKLETIKSILYYVWQSSKYKKCSELKHLITFDKFYSENKFGVSCAKLKNSYDFAEKFVELPPYDCVNKIIMDNIKRD